MNLGVHHVCQNTPKMTCTKIHDEYQSFYISKSLYVRRRKDSSYYQPHQALSCRKKRICPCPSWYQFPRGFLHAPRGFIPQGILSLGHWCPSWVALCFNPLWWLGYDRVNRAFNRNFKTWSIVKFRRFQRWWTMTNQCKNLIGCSLSSRKFSGCRLNFHCVFRILHHNLHVLRLPHNTHHWLSDKLQDIIQVSHQAQLPFQIAVRPQQKQYDTHIFLQIPHRPYYITFAQDGRGICRASPPNF